MNAKRQGYRASSRQGKRFQKRCEFIVFSLSGNSIFDNQGEGNDSTGLVGDGRSPSVPERDSGDVLVDLRPTPIDLNSQHVFQVDLTYDGTTLTETITDTVASERFTTTYPVNIPAAIGGNTAFMGFTGGTGGLTSTQEVQSWIYHPLQ